MGKKEALGSTEIRIDVGNAVFIGSYKSDSYEEVLKDFESAKTVKILTYSTSMKRNSIRMNALRNLPESTNVELIFALPKVEREKKIVEGKVTYGEYKREDIEKEIKKLSEILDLPNFKSCPEIKVCLSNHAKIIGTENVAYIGSANYSEGSYFNFEAGFIVRDNVAISKIYRQFLGRIGTSSVLFDDKDYIRIHFLRHENNLSYIKDYFVSFKTNGYLYENLEIMPKEALDELRRFLKKIKKSSIYPELGGYDGNISSLCDLIDDITNYKDLWAMLSEISEENIYNTFSEYYRVSKKLPPEKPDDVEIEMISEDEVFIDLVDMVDYGDPMAEVEKLWSEYASHCSEIIKYTVDLLQEMIDILAEICTPIKDKK